MAASVALTAASVVTFLATNQPLTPHAPTMATDILYACELEDASTPGQHFPCLWQAATQGNHRGRSVVFTAPGVPA